MMCQVTSTPAIPQPLMTPPIKRPRGRPPLGARLNANGEYELPPEAIEAAAARVVRHRTACRERYTATRAALRIAKPSIFKYKKATDHNSLDGFSAANGTAIQDTQRPIS